jgi:hypothetical protein
MKNGPQRLADGLVGTNPRANPKNALTGFEAPLKTKPMDSRA